MYYKPSYMTVLYHIESNHQFCERQNIVRIQGKSCFGFQYTHLLKLSECLFVFEAQYCDTLIRGQEEPYVNTPPDRVRLHLSSYFPDVTTFSNGNPADNNQSNS